MQFSWVPNPVPDEVAFECMLAALKAGSNTWSTATFYGMPPNPWANIELIGRFFKKYPEHIGKVQLVVKGGLDNMMPTNDKEVNRALLKKTQELLGSNVPIDVYSPARLLPGQDPVEYLRPFDELRKEGLFGALGLSEVNANTCRAAAAHYEIATVEIEISLWNYDQPTRNVIEWSKETKVPIYGYSPLGRGFLTRKFKKPEDIPDGNFLKDIPRFQGEAFYHNLKLVDVLDEIAQEKGITTAQLAIAWVLALSPYNIPIPASTNPERVTQNVDAGNIKLSDDDLKRINEILAKFETKGDRYPKEQSGVLML